MKKLILSAFAATFILGGCATTDGASSSGHVSGAKTSNEDIVTGSRIRRSDNNENYQGSKTMSGKEYQDYRQSSGLKSPGN